MAAGGDSYDCNGFYVMHGSVRPREHTSCGLPQEIDLFQQGFLFRSEGGVGPEVHEEVSGAAARVGSMRDKQVELNLEVFRHCNFH